MMPTIGVDARSLCFPPRGVGNFLRHLLVNMAVRADDLRFLLFVDRAVHPGNCAVLSLRNVRQVTVAPVRGYRFNVWQQLLLPIAAIRLRVDLMYHPSSSLPFWQPVPPVATVHDTKQLRRQKTLLGSPGKDGGRILPLALKKARRLIAVSGFTRKALMEEFQFPPQKLVTIYQGIGPHFRPLQDREAIAAQIRQRYGLTGRYLFALGCLGAASLADKNTSRLLRAVRRLIDGSGERFQLILAGLERDTLHHYEGEVRGLGLTDTVRLLGYVSEAELTEFYNCAELFIYPSLDEGFGLPPLEAMACGTVVVASDSTSIPEATGGVAFLADSREDGSLANKLAEALELIRDSRFRHERIQQGLAWASRFRWEATARAYRNVFRQELERGRNYN